MTQQKRNNVYDITERFEKKPEEKKLELPEPKEKLKLSDWAIIILLIYIGMAGVHAQW